jgi:hypothetical protein
MFPQATDALRQLRESYLRRFLLPLQIVVKRNLVLVKFEDYASRGLGVGGCRGGRGYAGHGPATVKLFRNLWDKKK